MIDYHIGFGFSRAYIVGVDPAKPGAERTQFVFSSAPTGHFDIDVREVLDSLSVTWTFTWKDLGLYAIVPRPTPRCLRPTPWSK